jgi:hypothetical protein
MTRRLPLCAVCGEPITYDVLRKKKDGRFQIELPDLPGKPIIGWHFKCFEKETLVGVKDDWVDKITMDDLAKIQSRGPSRVT